MTDKVTSPITAITTITVPAIVFTPKPTTTPIGSSAYSTRSRLLRIPALVPKAVPFFLALLGQRRVRSDISTRHAASQVRQAPAMCSSTSQAGSPVKYCV